MARPQPTEEQQRQMEQKKEARRQQLQRIEQQQKREELLARQLSSEGRKRALNAHRNWVASCNLLVAQLIDGVPLGHPVHVATDASGRAWVFSYQCVGEEEA